MTEEIKDIKVTSHGYSVPYGTVVTAPIDGTGDARLSEEDAERYDTRWVFDGDYVVVGEEEPTEPSEPKDPGDQYILTVPIKDLLELHDMFQVLPRTVVEKITLRTI